MERVIFYFLCSFILLSSMCVIVFRNPIKSVLALILTFFLTAILWILLRAEFLAVLLIIIYVGAVMVLFLFAVMLIDINFLYEHSKYIKFYLIFSIILAGLFLGVIYSIYLATFHFPIFNFLEALKNPELLKITVKLLGAILYSSYIVEFEIAGLLLFVGIVAAIVLVFRGSKNRKIQNLSEQIGVQKKQRMFISNL